VSFGTEAGALDSTSVLVHHRDNGERNPESSLPPLAISPGPDRGPGDALVPLSEGDLIQIGMNAKQVGSSTGSELAE